MSSRQGAVAQCQEDASWGEDVIAEADSPSVHGPYEFHHDGIVWRKPTNNGSVPTRLANFTARIVSEVTRDDGVEKSKQFEIEATIFGRTHTASVDSSRFGAMHWVTECMGAQAIIEPGASKKDHVRAAIQKASFEDIASRNVYTHTGWRQVGDDWCYLHCGGAIGPKGLDESVCVDLGRGLEHYSLPAPPTGDDLNAAILATVNLFELLEDEIAFPLFGAMWRSVLGTADFAIYLVGTSGHGKSEIATLVQQHFGAGFTARCLPESWESTANALEATAFAVKDAVLTIDDLAPQPTRRDRDDLQRKAARLFRSTGNSSGRNRLTATAERKGAKTPRGTVLGTGEDLPRGQSVAARMIILEVTKPEASWWKQLTRCQEYGRNGLFAAAMSGFLRWLAPRYENVKATMREKQAEYRAKASGTNHHRRTPDMVAHIMVGLNLFLDFASDVGAISDEQAYAYSERAWNALGEAAAAQAAYQRASDPVDRFFDLLTAAITSGLAHVVGENGESPTNAASYGWRRDDMGSWRPSGELIGWVSDDDLYLIRDTTYRVVDRAAGDGEGIALSQTKLWRALNERGHLKSTESGSRQTLYVRRRFLGVGHQVLHLSRSTIVSPVPDNSDNDDEIPY